MYTHSYSYICNILSINFGQAKMAAEAAKKTAPAPPPETSSSSVVKINVLLSAMLVRTINFFSETSPAEVFHCRGC